MTFGVWIAPFRTRKEVPLAILGLFLLPSLIRKPDPRRTIRRDNWRLQTEGLRFCCCSRKV